MTKKTRSAPMRLGDELPRLGLSRDLPRTRPVYRHVVRAFERAISQGTLATGLRLPAERALAAALGVSRATIVSAYRELETRGLVRGYVGRGTFVSAAPDSSGAPFAWRGKVAAAALRSSDSVIRDLVRDSINPKLISLSAGIPALDRFPADAFRRSLERVLGGGAAVWGHGATEGQPALREAIARRVGCQPENVLVLGGAQQGIDLLARCLIDPGDTVVVDRPGYVGAIQTFRAAGARLIGWDVVRHDVDELEDHLLRYRPKLIYTNPTFHNPTGWTMPVRVRRDFLALATRLRVPIIEDDMYRGLHFTSTPPPSSLHSLDTQSVVIYLSGFSKVLAPGLRLGYLVAAKPIVEQLAIIKQRADLHTQNLVQLVVADLLEDGTFDRHVSDLRTEHRRRRDALASALQRHGAAHLLRWTMPEGGLYFWCRLGGRLQASHVFARALEESIAFVRGETFYVDRAGEKELRLCFSTVSPARAEEAGRRLGRALAAARREIAPPPQLVAVV